MSEIAVLSRLLPLSLSRELIIEISRLQAEDAISPTAWGYVLFQAAKMSEPGVGPVLKTLMFNSWTAWTAGCDKGFGSTEEASSAMEVVLEWFREAFPLTMGKISEDWDGEHEFVHAFYNGVAASIVMNQIHPECGVPLEWRLRNGPAASIGADDQRDQRRTAGPANPSRLDVGGTEVLILNPSDGTDLPHPGESNNGVIDIFGTRFHVHFVRVEMKDGVQTAITDPEDRYSKFCRLDPEGAPFETVRIPGRDGEFVPVITPFPCL